MPPSMSANLLDDGVVGTLVSVWREQCSYIRFHKHAGQANPFAHGRNVADIGHGARDGRQASRLLQQTEDAHQARREQRWLKWKKHVR